MLTLDPIPGTWCCSAGPTTDRSILVGDVPVVDCAESTLSLSEAIAGLNAHDSAVVAGFVAEIEGVLAANVRRMQS